MLVALAGAIVRFELAKAGEENFEPDHNFKLLPPEATAPGRRHPYKERVCVHDILGPCSTSIQQGRG